jgi:aryl-alcohol dehydrogenase-like predicted oxidoreductase
VETRQLGAAGPQLTVTGLGTAPIGSDPGWAIYWGLQGESEALAAIRAAVDAGVGWIDTAPFYGWGRAEELVGRALDGRRDEVLLLTKCGTLPEPNAVSREDNRPETIRADLEASLRRLRTDYVDLLQIHDVDRSTPIEESWGEVQRAIEEGKVRYGGLSNHPADLVERAHAVAPVTACQEQLSLLAQPHDPAVLELTRRLGIGLLSWSPLASGFLVDGFDVETLHPDDFRRRSRFREAATRIERLRAFAAARGRTLRELAIAWVLAQPGVTAAIVGARTADEGAEIAGGTDWRLTDAELTELAAS